MITDGAFCGQQNRKIIDAGAADTLGTSVIEGSTKSPCDPFLVFLMLFSALCMVKIM